MNENNTKQNSKRLTRETALKLIDQKKSHLADLINNTSFFIQGYIEENDKFKREKFADNLDISEAKIGFKNSLEKIEMFMRENILFLELNVAFIKMKII